MINNQKDIYESLLNHFHVRESGMKFVFFVFAYKDGLGHCRGWYRFPSSGAFDPRRHAAKEKLSMFASCCGDGSSSFRKVLGDGLQLGWFCCGFDPIGFSSPSNQSNHHLGKVFFVVFSNHQPFANLSWKLFGIFWHMSTHINLWMICRLSRICACLGVRWVISTSYISNIDFFPWKCNRCGGLRVYPNYCYPKFTINVHQPCTCSSGLPTAPGLHVRRNFHLSPKTHLWVRRWNAQAMASWQTSFVGSVWRFLSVGRLLGMWETQKRNAPGGAVVFFGKEATKELSGKSKQIGYGGWIQVKKRLKG